MNEIRDLCMRLRAYVPLRCPADVTLEAARFIEKQALEIEQLKSQLAKEKRRG
jgi:hypothetical protein